MVNSCVSPFVSWYGRFLECLLDRFERWRWTFHSYSIAEIYPPLQNYGWLANSAVWWVVLAKFSNHFITTPRINLAIIFISMGFVAHSPPNFAAAETSLGVSKGPVVTQAFVHLPLYSQVGPSAESCPTKFISLRCNRSMASWTWLVGATYKVFVISSLPGLRLRRSNDFPWDSMLQFSWEYSMFFLTEWYLDGRNEASNGFLERHGK